MARSDNTARNAEIREKMAELVRQGKTEIEALNELLPDDPARFQRLAGWKQWGLWPIPDTSPKTAEGKKDRSGKSRDAGKTPSPKTAGSAQKPQKMPQKASKGVAKTSTAPEQDRAPEEGYRVTGRGAKPPSATSPSALSKIIPPEADPKPKAGVPTPGTSAASTSPALARTRSAAERKGPEPQEERPLHADDENISEWFGTPESVTEASQPELASYVTRQEFLDALRGIQDDVKRLAAEVSAKPEHSQDLRALAPAPPVQGKRGLAGERRKLGVFCDQVLVALVEGEAERLGVALSRVVDSALWEYFQRPALSFQHPEESER